MKTTGVFIGRFNPPHLGHLSVVKYALQHTDELVIVVGSYLQRPSLRNPFSSIIVQRMFRSLCIEHGIDVNLIRFEFIEDYIYNELKWETEIRRIVNKHNENTNNIYLTGFKKDNTSYYLKAFPEYSELEVKDFYQNLSSTDIRQAIFDDKLEIFKGKTSNLLFENTPIEIENEIELVKTIYKHKHDVHPFTVGNVIISSGHVLVEYDTESIHEFGVYKLPEIQLGNDTIQDTSLRLADDSIRLTRNILSARFSGQHIFDNPFRHDYGRQISTFRYYHLNNDEHLPKLKKSNLQWMPLFKVKPESFKYDHYHIIKYFTGY